MGNATFEQGNAIPQLSERLLAALEFLHERISADGHAITTEEEIGRRVGCTGSNAHNLLVRLSKERLVVLAGGKHRAVPINYPVAAPVLFLADARRMLAAGGKKPTDRVRSTFPKAFAKNCWRSTPLAAKRRIASQRVREQK